MFGQNAWEIAKGTPLNGNSQPLVPGQLDNLFADISASGVKYMRIGGIDVNFFPLYQFNGSTQAITNAAWLEHLIDEMRSNNIEPIIQVSYNPTGCVGPIAAANLNLTQQANLAKKLVDYINNTKYPNRKVKYWIIGNEFDRPKDCTNGKGYDMVDETFAGTISTYIKTIAQEMKTADPSIKIIGPEIAGYSTDASSTEQKIMAELISDPSSNSSSIMDFIPNTNLYYVDIISFHMYPSSSTRAAVIANPTGTSGFAAKCTINLPGNSPNPLYGIATLIENNVPGRNVTNCKIACTEFNLLAVDALSESSNWSSIVSGVGNRSFLGGQWWAEVLSYAMEVHPANNLTPWVALMCPWSAKEGGCSASSSDTFGYISDCSSGSKYSAYWHYQMVTNYIKGTFYRGTVTNDPNSSPSNIKVFSGSSCHGVNVMIMNQNTSSNTIDMSFGTTAPGTSNTRVALNIPNSSPAIYNTTIAGETTMLLCFDACGKLTKKLTYSKSDAQAYNAPQPDPNLATPRKSCICVKKANYTYDFPNSNLRCAVPTETGTAHYNSYSMSGNLKIQDSAYVTGTFTVPSGRTLVIDSAEVVFGTGASILVQSGGQLIISNSNLHGCTDSSWAGIRVIGNGSAGIFTITASRIADAIEAVRTEDVNDPFISGNVVENNGVCFNLIRARGFTIEGNEILNTRLAVKTSSTSNATAAITENLFYESDTCVIFLDDNHASLDITCNAFINYADYGIYSTDATLKDQGSSTYGPGNIFVSNSSQTNHQIYFTGPNSVIYYMDPSYMFTLEDELSLLLQEAENDGACREFSDDGGGVDGRKKNIINKAKAALANRSQLMNCVPNPAENEVIFNYTLEQNCHSGHLIITDILGTVVRKIDLDRQAKSVEMQLPEYSSGIYFYSLYADDKLVGTKKLIISK